jgi:hypothetical protein
LRQEAPYDIQKEIARPASLEKVGPSSGRVGLFAPSASAPEVGNRGCLKGDHGHAVRQGLARRVERGQAHVEKAVSAERSRTPRSRRAAS